MKKLIFVLSLMFFPCFSEQRHLSQETGKVLYYKVICIENSICIIDAKLDELRNHPERLEEILDEVKPLLTNCKNAIGIN